MPLGCNHANGLVFSFFYAWGEHTPKGEKKQNNIHWDDLILIARRHWGDGIPLMMSSQSAIISSQSSQFAINGRNEFETNETSSKHAGNGRNESISKRMFPSPPTNQILRDFGAATAAGVPRPGRRRAVPPRRWTPAAAAAANILEKRKKIRLID